MCDSFILTLKTLNALPDSDLGVILSRFEALVEEFRMKVLPDQSEVGSEKRPKDKTRDGALSGWVKLVRAAAASPLPDKATAGQALLNIYLALIPTGRRNLQDLANDVQSLKTVSMLDTFEKEEYQAHIATVGCQAETDYVDSTNQAFMDEVERLIAEADPNDPNITALRSEIESWCRRIIFGYVESIANGKSDEVMLSVVDQFNQAIDGAMIPARAAQTAKKNSKESETKEEEPTAG